MTALLTAIAILVQPPVPVPTGPAVQEPLRPDAAVVPANPVDGTWAVLAFERDGRPVATANEMAVTIRNGILTFRGGDESARLRPMRIELTPGGLFRVEEGVTTPGPIPARADTPAGTDRTPIRTGRYVLARDYLAFTLDGDPPAPPGVRPEPPPPPPAPANPPRRPPVMPVSLRFVDPPETPGNPTPVGPPQTPGNPTPVGRPQTPGNPAPVGPPQTPGNPSPPQTLPPSRPYYPGVPYGPTPYNPYYPTPPAVPPAGYGSGGTGNAGTGVRPADREANYRPNPLPTTPYAVVVLKRIEPVTGTGPGGR